MTKGINLVRFKYLHGKNEVPGDNRTIFINFKGQACLKNIITRRVITQVQNGIFNNGILNHEKRQGIY